MQNIEFINRLFRARRLLNQHIAEQKLNSAAILLSSAYNSPSSRDQHFEYRQNSDFLYFLGSEQLDNATLVISSKQPRPILIAESRSKEKIIWDGPGVNLKELASRLDLELVDTANVHTETIKKILNLDLLFYSNHQNSISSKIASQILETPTHLRKPYPQRLINSELITEKLRLYKSAIEVEAIIKSNLVANTALTCALPFIKAGKTESAIAATIEYGFKLQEADTGFATIVASAKNAAILHHRASSTVIKKGQLLLIDWGARLNGYCSDITRCLVVDSKFSEQQKDIYEIVLTAQLAAIKKVKAGVLVKDVYNAAVKELAIGLKHLSVLKQPISKIIDAKLYKPYFPHGIGHTLGLDVHDIGQMRSDQNIRLATGMVITIEPGLYFRNNIKNITACGVRIEDNLLVENSGSKILSAGFPKKIREIESLI